MPCRLILKDLSPDRLVVLVPADKDNVARKNNLSSGWHHLEVHAVLALALDTHFHVLSSVPVKPLALRLMTQS